MAECNILRCSQERRLFRRELSKWNKEILFILGLERLAEEIMGEQKWKILVQPFTDLESRNPIDWYPEETCYFCCSKKQPLYDPANGIIPSVDAYSLLQSDESSSTSGQLKVSTGSTCDFTLVSSQSIDQPLDLSIGTQKQPVLDSSIIGADLSSKTKECKSLKSLLKVPQVPLNHGVCKRMDTGSKRSYTEEELQAALRDIQSGKLGTRKAAVIYGIPRSTLRNKVYKLANESKAKKSKNSNINACSKEKKGEKDTQSSSEVISDIPSIAFEKSKEHDNSSYSNVSKDLKLPLLPDLIRHLAEERIELERIFHKDSNGNDQTESIESSLVSKPSSVILKVPSFKPTKSLVHSDKDDSSSPVLSSSPPPMSSHLFSGNRGIAVSLKELIARSINQKSNCDLKEEQAFKYPFYSSTVEGQTFSQQWSSENSLKDDAQTFIHINNSSNAIKSQKRIRPKRGRYRNYDRDNLIRAVVAVQKGEMSVHRAGTFYGVPHSTLEYKVKERHLLRPKKRDMFNDVVQSSSTEIIPSLKKFNNFYNESIRVKNVKNNHNFFDASSDHELSLHSITDTYHPPLSIWPFLSLEFTKLESSNKFFASEAMCKLQENAKQRQEIETRETASKTGKSSNSSDIPINSGEIEDVHK